MIKIVNESDSFQNVKMTNQLVWINNEVFVLQYMDLAFRFFSAK